MRRKSFGPTLSSLRRAYLKLLHENFENNWSSGISRNVRDLAAAIVWKLDANTIDAKEEGQELMIKMLEHVQIEFKWEKFYRSLSLLPTRQKLKRQMLTNVRRPLNVVCKRKDM